LASQSLFLKLKSGYKKLMSRMKIGIPRALLYYKQFPFWQCFFKTLGAEVIVSGETNAQILNAGIEAAPSEICLPVKVFYGHTLSLSKKCDYVFIPRVVSVEKEAYTCPKFMGLPDMLKALPNAPAILSIDINAKKKRRYYYQSLLKLATVINKNPATVLKAYKAAQKSLENFQQKQSVPPFEAHNDLKIGIVGHPYNIYDPYISLDFLSRLKRQKINIQTLENVSAGCVEAQTGALAKPIFWTYEKEVVGTVMHWLRSKTVDGIIYLLAFACGPDSMMQVLIEEEARKHPEVPLMSMVIDEHSGEAGFLTRLEAFTDMLELKKAKMASS